MLCAVTATPTTPPRGCTHARAACRRSKRPTARRQQPLRRNRCGAQACGGRAAARWARASLYSARCRSGRPSLSSGAPPHPSFPTGRRQGHPYPAIRQSCALAQTQCASACRGGSALTGATSKKPSRSAQRPCTRLHHMRRRAPASMPRHVHAGGGRRAPGNT